MSSPALGVIRSVMATSCQGIFTGTAGAASLLHGPSQFRPHRGVVASAGGLLQKRRHPQHTPCQQSPLALADRDPVRGALCSGVAVHGWVGGHQSRRAIHISPSAVAAAAAAGPPLDGQTPEERHANELHTLNVAIGVNIVIFAAKLAVHMVTGSSAMLAEALHSIADVLNQMLLRIGVLKARKGPTEMHPYGFARDRFVWSLISAVGIFFLGAGASFIHGVHTLSEHSIDLQHMGWSYLVLGMSAVLEGYSLWVATKFVIAGAKARRMDLLQYIRSGKDPTTVAVMMEDGGAVMGLAIAAACTALAHATGNPVWDAAGSILVGCLLGAIATFLVQKNRQLLIGRSMSARDVQAVQDLLKADPVVAYVTDTKTEEIGPQIYRFKAEVAWNGEALVQRYLDRCGRARLMDQLRQASLRNDGAAVESLIRAYGRDIISAVGAEVDRIEAEIQQLNPGVVYVDLETDRGRNDPVRRGLMDGAVLGASAPGAQIAGDCYTCTVPSDDDLAVQAAQAASTGAAAGSSSQRGGGGGADGSARDVAAGSGQLAMDLDLNKVEATQAAAAAVQPPAARLEAEPEPAPSRRAV